jgi:insertion element IS1 protein InsB
MKAQIFWYFLPEEYQQNAQSYTDFWAAYSTVISPENHHPSNKNEGETNHIERFNNTLRTSLPSRRRGMLKTGQKRTIFFKKLFQSYECNLLFY